MKQTITAFLLLIASAVVAQRNCPTTLNLSQMQAQDPARYQRFMDLETFTANYIANQSSPNQRLINANGIITIPVVVHVLHRGEAEGTGRNISLAQIQSQIDVLNEDFRRLNADRVNTPAAFAGVASDYGFEFRLACQDPDGNPTDGIIRRQTDRNNFQFALGADGLPDENAMGIKMTGISGSDPWPTNRYLNIWVADFNDGTLGYGTWPADFAARPQFDGVVVETTAFGRVGNVSAPFDRGRTATHEVGHWLNLRHINGDAVCGDDFVGDTPPQSDLTSGCPGFPNASGCPGANANGRMFMNYMDFTNDDCMNIYTNGQRLRGRALFAAGGPRAAFIDNYFRVQQPATTLNCIGTVNLFNPNCLPVSWAVVSGPATISSSNNTSASLSISASGVVVLRATAGNYISEANINVNTNPPAAPTITNLNFDRRCGTFMEAYSNNPDGATGYIWNLNFGQVVQDMDGYGSDYIYVNPLINSPQTGQSYYNYISVQAKNACGVSGPSATRQFTVGPVPSTCGSGGTCQTGCANCCPILLRVSPNPSSDNMTIETTNNSTFTKLRVIDKMGNVKRELTYPAGTKKVNLRIADLPADIYRLQATDGKNWTTVSFSKQ